MKRNELFIYLARLDRKGIKVLANFVYSQKVHPTRVQDIKNLVVGQNLPQTIYQQIHENRMNYELYVESAESFQELKKSLSNRGYSHLPIQQFAGRTESITINEKSLVTDESTMIRKGSSKK